MFSYLKVVTKRKVYIPSVPYHTLMKPLPKIDLTEYNTTYDGYNYKKTLEELIKKVKKEEDVVDFINELLAIIQIYFDGLIHNRESNQIEKEILDNLFLAGKKIIGSFYRGEPIDLENIREIFLPYAPYIIKYGDKKSAKDRHLERSYESVQTFGLTLPEILSKDGMESLDTLVCIATGAFEPSFLAMDIIEKEDLIAVRYSHFSRNDPCVRIPRTEKDIISKIKKKKVLVIEDIIISGDTLINVMSYLAKMEPDKLYGTSVIGKLSQQNSDLDMKIINERNPFFYEFKS